MPREPQSYGSEKDWQTGKTGQQVSTDDRTQTADPPENAGGSISPVQLADSEQPEGAPTGASTPVQKVTDREGGAKRNSYFRKRDYE